MRKIKSSFFIFLAISIFFSCANDELNDKQAELDRNRSLWQSQEVSHYWYTEDDLLSCSSCDALHFVFGYPRTIYISNNNIYSIILVTNGFEERDFEEISYLWNRYLISNTFEFFTSYVYSKTIDKRFDNIQNFINEAKNDTSINHLFGYQDYTIDVTYDQRYGYPT